MSVAGRLAREMFRARQGIFWAFERLAANGVDWTTEPPDLLRAAAPPAERAARRPLRIVIVDDYAPIRRLLGEYLASDGHAVVGEAENGRDALELLARTRCDVVIMDLNMPGIDGERATRALAARPGAPVVIAFTGEATRDAHHRRMLDAGAVACFPKTWVGRLRAYLRAMADGHVEQGQAAG